jgi:hypothetical protein
LIHEKNPSGRKSGVIVPLTLFCTPLKKTFNTFKRFYADPDKIFYNTLLRSGNNPLQYLILLRGSP